MKVTLERAALLKSLGHVHRVVERPLFSPTRRMPNPPPEVDTPVAEAPAAESSGRIGADEHATSHTAASDRVNPQ